MGVHRCPPKVYELPDLFTEAFELLDVSIDYCFPTINVVLRLDVFTVCWGFLLVIHSGMHNKCIYPCVRSKLISQTCSSRIDAPPGRPQFSLAKQLHSHVVANTCYP